MKITRRALFQSALFGAGAIGLRALVTGIPAAVLMKGAKAIAAPAANGCVTAPQYVVFATSGNGDPMNANAPGMYDNGLDTAISHAPSQVKTPININGTTVNAGAAWAQLPTTVLAQSQFWHIMTNTPVHPKEGDVLGLLGATTPNEMLPSLLAKTLAPCLGTLQTQPLTVGATTPSEGLRFDGEALPIIPPLALAATLTNPGGPLANLATLQSMRDQTLMQLDEIYGGQATKAQKAYIDSLITSQQQVRGIRQDLLATLGRIKDNSVASQISAALTLFQMNVTPVIAIHIPFGGDNHNDQALATEDAQTTAGVASIASLFASVPPSLQGKVSMLALNVFGRTLTSTSTSNNGNVNGRQHNPNHQVSLAIGAPFKGMVVGGVQPVLLSPGVPDFGCTGISVASGGVGADIQPTDTLASYGKTMLAAFGADSATINSVIASGSVVTGALSS